MGRVLFLGFDSGPFYFRGRLPALFGGWDVLEQNSVSAKPGFRRCEHEAHDVVVVHMPVHEWQEEQVERLRRRGVRIVVDVDDYVRGVSESDSGVAHQFPRGVVLRHERLVREADALFCSTEWLRDKYAHPKSFVLPNMVDLRRYSTVTHEHPFGFTVGWSGGTGHLGALRRVSNDVTRFILAHNEAGLVLMGDAKARGCFPNLPDERVKMIPWTSMYEYPPYLRGFDVGLAPALDNGFYRGKSALRLYDYGACSVPGVYGLPTYAEALDAGQAVVGETASSWLDALEAYHTFPEARLAAAKKGREYVRENVVVDVRGSLWREALGEVMS